MAHFAQLNENNVVVQVIVVDNADIIDKNGNESEQLGIDFCKTLLGSETNWIQTSYNASFRKNYAGIGMLYDATRNAFLHAQPYASWTLNETTCRWEAPVAMPTDHPFYDWDENSQQWVDKTGE